MEAPSTSSNPNPSGDWSVVLRRRRGGNHRHTPPGPQLQTLTPTLAPPSPWTPSDTETDPQRESRLLKRMQSSINRLESSRFYRGFLSRLRDPQIQDGLARVLAAGPEIQIVVYGIGSIESYDPPRLQLALAVLLRRDLGRAVGSVEVFDPVLSAAECVVVEALGCAVLRRDERGRREAATPTLFYMPHCEAALYDNLLSAGQQLWGVRAVRGGDGRWRRVRFGWGSGEARVGGEEVCEGVWNGGKGYCWGFRGGGGGRRP